MGSEDQLQNYYIDVLIHVLDGWRAPNGGYLGLTLSRTN